MEWPAGARSYWLTVALLVLSLAVRNASAVAGDGNKGTCTGEFARGSSEEVLVLSRRKEKLRIAVPRKHGFEAFVNITIHPETKKPKVTGYSIEVFKRALEKLNDPPQYDFCVFDGTYDELVGNVSTGVYDAAVGDVTITAERVKKAEFTMPYLQSGLSLLMLSQRDSKTIQWIFLEPLTRELWVAIVCGFFFTGFVLWMIEHPSNPKYQGSGWRQLSDASYFAFSTLSFSHESIIRSPMSKFVLVVWCFAVLVLVQSYAANLSSMLTAKRLRPWATDLNQVVQSGGYIGIQDATFVGSFLRKRGVPEKNIKALRNQTQYAEALRKGSKNGGVSVIVDEIPYLNYFLTDPGYKKEFEMVNRIYWTPKEFEMFNSIYRTPGLGFVFHLGCPLVHDLSEAILDLTQGDEVSNIEERWLGRAFLSTRDNSPVADSAPLTLQSFSGLFVITGCVSTLMLLIRVSRSIYARYYNGTRGSSLEHPVPEDGTADPRESTPLQDTMGNGYVPDQRHGEDGMEQSLQVHGSSVDVSDSEPCQIHSGSVPADSVEIEMGSSPTRQGVGMDP